MEDDSVCTLFNLLKSQQNLQKQNRKLTKTTETAAKS